MEIRQIIEKYQERLVNISGRNRTLITSRLHKKSSFDIHELSAYQDDFLNRLLADFVLGDAEQMLLLPEPERWHADEKRKLQQSLKENPDQAARQAALDEGYEQLLGLSKHLASLRREIANEIRETGIANLKLAYHFVEGKLADDSCCRAPLALLPVSLEIKDGRWFLVKGGAGFSANEVFLMAATQSNKQGKGEAVEEKDESNGIDEIRDVYSRKGIVIAFCGEGCEAFQSLRKEDYDKYSRGELVERPFIVLGRFPASNAIHGDYARLLDEGACNRQILNLLGRENTGKDSGAGGQDPGTGQMEEGKCFYVSELDFSQEMVLKSAEEEGGMVVFGPPGTGKSQTIVNLIADNLAKGRRVLVVSQKRAALDVIYNRLDGINGKAVLIHDAEADRKDFYERTASLLEVLEESCPGEKEAQSRLCELSAGIDGMARRFGEINAFLFTASHKGFTGAELFSLAPKRLEDWEDHRKARQQFRKVKPLFPEEMLDKEKMQDFHDRLMRRDYSAMIARKRAFEAACRCITDLNSSLNLYYTSDYLACANKINAYARDIGQMPDKYNLKEQIKAAVVQGADQEALQQYMAVQVQKEFNELLRPECTGFKRKVMLLFSKKKVLRREEEKKTAFNKVLFDVQASGLKMLEAHAGFCEELENAREFLRDPVVDGTRESLKESYRPIDTGELEKAFEAAGSYMDLLVQLDHLHEEEQALLEQAAARINDDREFAYLLDHLMQLFVSDTLEELASTPEYRKIQADIKEYPARVAEVNKHMEEKKKSTKVYINSLWSNKLVRAAKEHDFKEFKRICGLKRRIRSIRQTCHTFPELVFTLYPCVLMGPETVSAILPLQKDLFDVVVFDEASQMYVENAIPALYRGKKAIIAGDDKQLKPSSLFSKRFEMEDEGEYEDFSAAQEEESLLDLAKTTCKSAHLDFHYRSRYLELINFSNHAFYNGRLRLSPNVAADPDHPPIKRIMVADGAWINRRNDAEAMAVVKLLKKIFDTRQEGETIGIITFNIGQMEAIEDHLDSCCGRDDDFRRMFQEETSRKDGSEDIGLFIKNIENVQGDERDIIIFSTGYAKNEKGRLATHFGSLSANGGENRLNVGFSRARKQIYLTTSFEPEELDVEASQNEGPRYFKQYLLYARAVSSGNADEAAAILASMSSRDAGSQINRFDSAFEEEVYTELTAAGYDVHTQVGASGYRIDLAVFDASKSRYVLGIECDGASYHSSRSARERDIHRQRFLESRGWKIHRIWSSDWWENKALEIQKAIEAIRRFENY